MPRIKALQMFTENEARQILGPAEYFDDLETPEKVTYLQQEFKVRLEKMNEIVWKNYPNHKLDKITNATERINNMAERTGHTDLQNDLLLVHNFLRDIMLVFKNYEEMVAYSSMQYHLIEDLLGGGMKSKLEEQFKIMKEEFNTKFDDLNEKQEKMYTDVTALYTSVTPLYTNEDSSNKRETQDIGNNIVKKEVSYKEKARNTVDFPVFNKDKSMFLEGIKLREVYFCLQEKPQAPLELQRILTDYTGGQIMNALSALRRRKYIESIALEGSKHKRYKVIE